MKLFYCVAILFLSHGILSAEDLFSLYGKTQEAFKKKDYGLFLTLSEQLLSKAPGVAGIQFQYARALAASNRSQEALKTLRSVARMGGSPPASNDEAFIGIKDSSEFQSILNMFERNRISTGRSKVAFVVPGKDLIPEGIAFDRVEQSFYIGSTYRRKIIKVDKTGVARDFTAEKQDGLWGLVGMEVDPVRRHLWANTAHADAATMGMIDPDPATQGRTAIFKYDLTSGKLLKKYEGGSKERPRFFNDVAIAPNGDVYISESSSGEVYRILTQKDSLELLIPADSMGFPNGIAISDDGNFLYISHIEGITVVDLIKGDKQLIVTPPDTQAGNHDGMIFYKNSLIGIQGLTGGIDRIVRFHLKNPKEIGRVEVLQINHPLFVLPTTGDMAGDEFYFIANSQLRSFDDKGKIFSAEKLNDPVILKVDLLESEKAELQAVHDQEREAHLKTDVDMLTAASPDEFVTVSSGKIHRVTREDERKMFHSYFDGAVYSEYEDLEPPIISVSDDGRSGWVITRTRVKRTQGTTKTEFVYAGIMTYEKQGDRWIRVANVSTFES